MFSIFINPSKFSKFAQIIQIPLIIISLITLLIGLIIIFFYSPNDYQQGSTVKIMYVHVPAAWLSMLIFFIMTIYSIIGLAFKIPFGFIINSAVAPIGATFTLICLITGSLWGKPMWGTWWVWDARLTSVAILFLLYLIIIILKNSFSDVNVGEKITAILIIVGSINLPIIKFSVDWWNTLHQPASIKLDGTSSIHSSMLLPLMLMLLVLLLYSALILLMKYKTEIIRIKKKNIKRI